MEKKRIRSFTFEELQTVMEELGEKPFHAKQVYEWVHVKLASDFEQMTNLSKSLREKLEAQYVVDGLSLVDRQISKMDGTNKFLFELIDGNTVESVLMRYHHGNSVCISSQVGCRMGCRFCASTLDGLTRNLDAGEMLEQIYQISRITGERVANVVVMGTGEPLDNYDQLLTFIQMLCDERGLHISGRGITVSTCGLVPKIRQLADEKLPITLALSLHGATQEKREKLMPIARKYPLPQVMAACDEYFAKTGRRMSYEYSLVQGVNDTEEDIRQLTSLLKGKNCHLNLIPVNPIKERDFVRPTHENAVKFQNRLEKNGINVTIRREMGTDIDGACGQLRQRHLHVGSSQGS